MKRWRRLGLLKRPTMGQMGACVGRVRSARRASRPSPLIDGLMLVVGRLPLPPARSELTMSRSKTRPVVLSPAERNALTRLVRTGSHPAQQVRRARILLELDEGDPDREGPVPRQAVVAERAGVHVDTVVKVSRVYAERGGDVQATISRKKRATPPVAPTVTGEVEARLVALACSAPPPGYDRWSLRLRERHVVLIDDLPDLDHSTIGRVLKKTNFALI